MTIDEAVLKLMTELPVRAYFGIQSSQSFTAAGQDVQVSSVESFSIAIFDGSYRGMICGMNLESVFIEIMADYSRWRRSSANASNQLARKGPHEQHRMPN